MPFESLEQAYHLYNYKRKVFNQIAGAYGVPQLWHDYKRLRDTGSTAKDAAKQVHRYTIKKWQMVLKTPYINDVETGIMVGNIQYPKSGGTEENPIVFISYPTPLKNEKWDNRYLKSDKFGKHKNRNFLEFDDIEVSSYGRVKKNGKVIMPTKTQFGLKVTVRGEKIRFFRDEDGFKSERTGKKGLAHIRYSVSLQMLRNLNETVPEDAVLFVGGERVSNGN